MKISKIPGLGRFGLFIDGLNINDINDDLWQEIGKLHLQSLVIIIRDVGYNPEKWEQLIATWGDYYPLHRYEFIKKHKLFMSDKNRSNEFTEEEKKYLQISSSVSIHNRTKFSKIHRVSADIGQNGVSTGAFSDGPVHWHNDELGHLCFHAGVSLYSIKDMKDSSTGFLVTAEWYENQSDSFKSELNELILEHQTDPKKINSNIRPDQLELIKRSMGEGIQRLPLVIKSPNGIVGIRYNKSSAYKFKDMSIEESQKIFDKINKTLFVEKYSYDYNYSNTNDICLFDNSITLHRRAKDSPNRLLYRLAHNFSKLVDISDRYFHTEYDSKYQKQLHEINLIFTKNAQVNNVSY